MPDAREKIAKGFEEISAAYRKMFPSKLDAQQPSLIEYAWRNFDAKRCLRILVSSEPSYKLHKDLIFSALCSWVVCPHRNGLRRHGMVLVAIEAMCRNEVLGQAAFPENLLLGDLLGRLSPEYWDFYEDFYYPVGGLKTLIKSTSPETYRASIENRSSDVPFVSGLMSVLHYHADNLRGKRPYLKASLNKAAPTTKAVYGIGSRSGWAADNLDNRWQKLKGTVALSYAALSIEIGEGRTLLDAMREGEASYADHGQHLSEWLGRARYVTAHVLAPMAKPDAARIAESYLPDFEDRPFPPRAFTAAEESKMRKGFTAHNAS